MYTQNYSGIITALLPLKSLIDASNMFAGYCDRKVKFFLAHLNCQCCSTIFPNVNTKKLKYCGAAEVQARDSVELSMAQHGGFDHLACETSLGGEKLVEGWNGEHVEVWHRERLSWIHAKVPRCLIQNISDLWALNPIADFGNLTAPKNG